MPDGNGAAERVEPIRRYLPDDWLLPAVLPGLQIAQHLTGERFVHLDEIDIGKPQVRCSQNSRHRQTRAHEKTIRRVDARVADSFDECQRLAAIPLGGLFGHEQQRGGAIGQRARIARRDGAGGGAVENRLQCRELLDAGIRADQQIPLDVRHRHDLRRQPAVLGGSMGVAMAAPGELVLGLSADGPLLHHQLAVLAHAEAGGGLGDGGCVGPEIPRAQAQ